MSARPPSSITGSHAGQGGTAAGEGGGRSRPALSSRDRALAWLVTGPLARLVAFTIDFVAALARAARGERRHPEERRRD